MNDRVPKLCLNPDYVKSSTRHTFLSIFNTSRQVILALFYFLWSCGETAEFPAALFTHKLYSCPLEGALILKSWVKIATLVINYFKKVLRKAFVLVM